MSGALARSCLAIALSVAALDVAQSRTPTSPSLAGGARNPVYDPGSPFADPAVMKAGDGFYYAYATQLKNEANTINVRVAKSRDLVSWETLPDAMPQKPAWADKRQNFWAPHVSFFGGNYLMYLSAEQNEGGYCIAVGTSARPEGPFEGFERMVCGKSFENIDPMAFEDPISKRKYLYWGSASKPIWGQEMNHEGTAFKPGSQPVAVVSPIREPRGTVQASDGWTYAFGTQIGPEDRPSNVQASRTKDFVNWEKLPDAMPVRPSWAKGTPDHWAPQVVRRGAHFEMYLSIEIEGDRSCISVGSSASPAGPYSNFQQLDCGAQYKLVNPVLGVSPVTGRPFLTWEAREAKHYQVRELDPSGRSFAAGSVVQNVQLPPAGAKIEKEGYEDLIEGAWVHYRNGFYYMFYSGNECCSDRAHYAVSVARARSPLGPYEKMAESRGTRTSVILKGDERWLGPGHNSVLTDEEGRDWMVYHGIRAGTSRFRNAQNEAEMHRVLLVQPMHWARDGWPEMTGGVAQDTFR